MKFLIPFFTASILLTASCSKEDLKNLIDNTGLTDSEIAEGLKSALIVGTDTSTSLLSKTDGYYADLAVKILLPAEVSARIEDFKSASINLGFTTISGSEIYNNGYPGLGIQPLKNKETELVKGINRAAENAANVAGPIFVDAITAMTITDAKNILFGDSDTAATSYLKANTFTHLFNEYEPKIDNALESFKIGDASVVAEYESYVADFNAIVNTSVPGFGTIGSLANVNPIPTTDLSAYATTKGLNGLFLKVSEEEEAIRKDPLARVNDILKRVFGQLD